MSLTITKDPNAHASIARPFTWELTWTPDQYYPAGSTVEIRSRYLRSFHHWQIVGSEIESGDVVYRWPSNPAVSDIWTNPNRILVKAKLPYGAKRDEPLVIRLTCIPSMWAGLPQHVTLWTRAPAPAMQTAADASEPDAIEEAGSEVLLNSRGGPVERLNLYATPSERADGKVRLILSPEDRYGNPTAFTEEISGTLLWDGNEQTVSLKEKTVVSLTPSKETARATFTVNLDDLALEENICNGVIGKGQVVVTGNPVWSKSGELIPSFGEFHWHTELSGDGQRSVADALDSAHNHLNLDWATPTDHNPMGETWEASVKDVEAAYQPGGFATLFGWESSTHIGHENLYFTDPNHPLVCGGSAGFRGGVPRDCVEAIKKHGNVLVIPHHTNAVSESRRKEDDAPFWHPYDWSQPTEHHRLTEIFQVRGNQERNDYPDAWRAWHQRNGSSVQDALQRGYRVGFTGGTDNHCGCPGRGHAHYEGGNMHPIHSQMMTGAWLSKLERQPLFDGLYARHTWAVWGTRAVVWFTVNGALMGDDLTVKEGEALTAEIKASAEAPWQSVELVSEGETLWSSAFHTQDFETTVDLGKAAADTHIYLRALLRNGGLVYASPVFIELNDK